MDIVFAIGVIAVVFITFGWIGAFLDRKHKSGLAEPLGGIIYGGVVILLVWGAIILGLAERIRTGQYPLALLRLLGLEPTN